MRLSNQTLSEDLLVGEEVGAPRLFLPAHDGLSATEIVCAKWPAMSLIVESGRPDEEPAIDSLTSSATD